MTGDLVEDLRLLEPANPLQVAYLGIGALLFFFLFWLLLRLLPTRKTAPHRSPRADAKAARKKALAALDQLSSLLGEGDGRVYAIESSGVVREYIERRFGLRAPVLVTGEFLENAKDSPYLASHHPELLADYLRCCDLLKFGRRRADRAELERIHAAAIRFVMESRFTREEATG